MTDQHMRPDDRIDRRCLPSFIKAKLPRITDGLIEPDALACRLKNKTPLPFWRDAQMESF
ncbi:MAG: hypothetical protein ISQ21_01240 [Alphaproteobacteria bacterium]|nr:hypothetical protein [Alphaproteobacteria bacterium]